MREKFFSIICAFSLLINSILPLFSVSAVSVVYAEEATSAAEEPTPSPSVEPEESPTPTPEATLEPTPTPSVEPTSNPEPSPSPSVLPEPSPSLDPSPAPSTEPTPGQEQNTSSPEPTVGQPNAPPEESPSPAPTPEPLPSVEVEQAPTGNLSAIILENTDAESLELDLSTQNDVSSATLTTDKGDYAPTDTVIVSGSDFTPNTEYTLIISSSDEPAVNFEAQVTTNDQGSFIYSYQLDGNYRPNYSVELKDEAGNIVATTAFTDAPVSGCTNDSAGANDQPNQKDLSKMCVNYSGLPTSIDVSWNWDDTGFSGKNTGDACSLYDTDGDGLANYSLCVGVTGDPAAWSYTKLYSCGDGRVDRCDQPTLLINNPTSSCSASVQGTDPFPGPPNNEQGDDYPNDTEANCNVNVSDVGGSTAVLLDVCSYPSDQPNSDPSDCIIIQSRTGKLEVVKDLIPGTDSGLFNLQINGVTEAANVGDGGTTGEKVLDEGAHTVGETAGTSTNLGNYTTAIVCKDLNGTGSIVAQSSNAGPLSVNLSDQQDIVCTITNSLQDGTIIVHKDVQGPNGEDVSDSTSFTVNLDGADAESITESTTVTYNNVAAGTHTITEDTPPAGYTLFSMTPDNDAGTSGAQITVNPGLTTDVYVVNRQQLTQLTLIKTVINDNGGTKQVADFTLKIDGDNVTSGVANEVSPGSHTASEVSQTGYSASSWGGDCNSDGTITLALGDNKTCTITNDDTPAYLIVIKHVIKDNGGNAVASDFTMTINDVIASGGNSFPGQAAPGTNKTLTTVGSYSVTESGPTGYNASFSSDCNGSIALGQTKTCTITNNDVAPTIQLNKVVINNNGGNAGSNDFGLTIGGQSVDSGQTLTVNANTPLAINEAGLPGYTFVSITGDAKCPSVLGGSVTLDEDEDITCTITNNDDVPSLTLVKQVTNNNGGNAQATDWILTASGPTGFSGPGPSVSSDSSFKAGTYNLSESGPSGYSASSWFCQGGTQDGNHVTLNLGESATCTITNDDQSASITLIKEVINNNGGNAGPNDFGISIGGQVVNSGTTLDVNSHTPIAIDEAGLTGYSFVSITGDNKCPATLGETVALNEGEDITCTITNDDQPAHLIVIKKVVKDNGGTANPADFTMTINGVVVQSGGSSFNGEDTPGTVRIVEPGTYNVTESGPSGYSSNFSADCSGIIALGETKTCTVTNNDIAPTLTLIKYLPNNNGGRATESDFKVYVNGQLSSWGQHTLSAGQYTISEDTLIGYAPSAWGTDCDVDGTITLNPGDNKICTITNDDVEPTLTLIKNLPNNNGGTATQDDFNVYIDDESAVWGQNTVDAGDLTVSEDTLPGYEPSVWGGDCDEDGGISLLPGDNKTCEITNDDQPAHLILVKNLPNDNGGTATQDDFDVSIDEQEAFWGDNEVSAGSHTVNESTLAGYTPSGWGQDCDEDGNVSLLPGETKTCTITNDDAAALLVVKKQVINNDGGTLDAINFTLNVTGNQPDPASFPGSESGTIVILGAGAYSVDETEVPGYEKSLGEDCAGTIANGESKTCIITNDDQPGSISGIKWNDEDGNGEQDCEDDSDEFCETGLEGWTIFLDKDDNGVLDEGEDFEETDEDGFYTFTDLDSGAYRVCEELQDGWEQTFPDNDELNNCHLVTVSSDEDVEDINFGNQGRGTISVHKNVDNNGDGQVDEENATNWTWDIDGQGDFATGDSGQEVAAGSYAVSEDQKEGFHVTDLECNDGNLYGASESVDVTLEAGQDLSCTFTNTRDSGSITIVKDIDNNGDGDADDVGDVKGATDWTWDILDGDQDNPTGQTKTLSTGIYTISEDQKAGHLLLGWTCSNEQTGTTNSININVTSDSTTTCTFTNQLVPPVLTLTKANNRTGIDVGAGSDVLYTLTVTLTGSPLSNVSLIDLPPAGFKYRSGSWTAVSSERGDLKPEITTEPTYASPGTWSLGDMVTGETVTLTYIADIDNSTDPGLYKDLAWSSGEGQTSSTVLANEDSGFFVGTEVNVVAGSGDSAGVNVVREERGEVLGVSTELPQTGINTLWSILAVLLLASGAGLIFAGISLRRKYE